MSSSEETNNQNNADLQFFLENTESSYDEFLANDGDVFNKNQNKNFKKYGAYAGTEEYDKAKAQELENRKRLGRYGQKKRGGVLRYPLESLTEHTDYLQIDIEKYVPIGSSYISSPGDDNRYVFGSDRAGRKSSSRLSNKPLVNDGTILLPIPSNLQDTNNVQYDSSTLNGLAAAGVQAAEGVMNIDLSKGLGGAVDQFGSVLSEAKKQTISGVGNVAAATDTITKFLASKAVNIFGANVTTNQLLARGNGEILNPNMELLFGGPTLRNFRFSFKMTPRNEKEAEQVKLIIRAFKRNMAPQAQGGTLGSGNWFLKTPNVFKLRYRTGRKNHPFLNRFKQCFLSDVQTTYTGEGTYATYDDGTPVSMILDLSFKEIQPIYDIDYDEKPGTEGVGY
mgnify:CR=1 FL=1